MKTIKGDLVQLTLQGHFDIIIHGCNCDCLMGAGIAKMIRATFPEAYAADLATIPGDAQKLGSYSLATVQRGSHTVTVVNAYTQIHPSGAGVLVRYEAIQSVMRSLKTRFTGQRFGYPKIGAGLARGDWSVIAQIIDEELLGEDHTLVEYAP